MVSLNNKKKKNWKKSREMIENYYRILFLEYRPMSSKELLLSIAKKISVLQLQDIMSNTCLMYIAWQGVNLYLSQKAVY